MFNNLKADEISNLLQLDVEKVREHIKDFTNSKKRPLDASEKMIPETNTNKAVYLLKPTRAVMELSSVK